MPCASHSGAAVSVLEHRFAVLQWLNDCSWEAYGCALQYGTVVSASPCNMRTDTGSSGTGTFWIDPVDATDPSATAIAATKPDSWMPARCVMKPPFENPVT